MVAKKKNHYPLQGRGNRDSCYKSAVLPDIVRYAVGNDFFSRNRIPFVRARYA